MALSENQKNYIKICSLLVDCCGKILRKRLQILASPDVYRFLFSKQAEIRKLNLYEHQQCLIFPQSGEDIDLSKWDISLLCRVLGSRDICEGLDDSERETVEKLRKIRNSHVSHSPRLQMELVEYEQICAEIEQITRVFLGAINDEAFIRMVSDEIQMARAGVFDVSQILENIDTLHEWCRYDREVLEVAEQIRRQSDEIGTKVDDIEKGQIEDRQVTQEMMRQISFMYVTMKSKEDEATHHDQNVTASSRNDNSLQMCKDMEFSTDNLHPHCQHKQTFFMSAISKAFQPVTVDSDSGGYFGTKGTVLFDQGMRQYVPLRFSAHPPTSNQPAATLLGEVCIAVYNRNATVVDLRRNPALLIEIRVGPNEDIQLRFHTKESVQDKNVPRVSLKNGGFAVEFGLVMNGLLSKISLVDSFRELVVKEIERIDFSHRLAFLFGVFQYNVNCYLYTRPVIPAICWQLCPPPIRLCNNIGFDRLTLHHDNNVKDKYTFDHQYLIFQPSLSQNEPSSPAFVNYPGARTTLQVNEQSVVYFQCTVVVDPTVANPSEDGVVAEISLCSLEDTDVSDRIGGRFGSVSLQVMQGLDEVEIRVLHGGSTLPHSHNPKVTRKQNETLIPVGVLINGPSKKVHIVNWAGNTLVTTVGNVAMKDTLYVVCGVFRKDVQIVLHHKCRMPKVCSAL